MRLWMRVTAMVTMLGAALLAGCGGGGDSSSDGNAQVRLLNASVGYPSLDLLVDTATANSAVTYGAAGAYGNAATSGVSTVVTINGSTSALSTATRTFSKDIKYTIAAYGWAGGLKTALIQEDVAAADAGKTKLMVLNLAPDAGTLDIYLTGSDEALDTATPLATGVAGGGSVGYMSVTAGTYRLRVTANGDKNDLRLDVQGLTLASTKVDTLMLTSGTGGVLVNALLAEQQGAVTKLSSTQARARVVSAVGSNGQVTARVAGVTLAAAATSPTIGTYAMVPGGNAPVVLSVDGTPLSVADLALTAGGDYTLLVWGSAAAPQVTLITEDNRLPLVATNAKLRLINATSGTPTALTLTADFSAVAPNVAQGQAATYGSIASSTSMRLDVSSPTNSALYSLTNAAVAAKGLYTMYIFGTAASPEPAFRKER